MIELTEWYRTRQESIRWRIEKIIREDIHYSSWWQMICRISSKLRDLFHSQIICILVLSFFLKSSFEQIFWEDVSWQFFLRYIVDDQNEVIRFPDNIDTIVYQETQENQSRHDVTNVYIYIYINSLSIQKLFQSPELYLIRHTESCSCHFKYREVFQIWLGSVSVQFWRRYSDLELGSRSRLFWMI